jgi:Protein of unknown function (DUF3592)
MRPEVPSMNLDAATIRTIHRVIGVIGLVVGLTVLIGGGYWVHHHHLDQFLYQSAVADGQIAENQRVDSYRHGYQTGTAYRAIVQFTDRSGETVVHQDWISFNPPSFFVGQHVRIFYDPQHSRASMIDRGPKNYYLPLFLAAFGGLAVLGSIQRLRAARS